jgi:serine/threonine protein kinase
MATEEQAKAPSAFGRYTLLERLAVGGMAEVFRAKITSSHGFEKILVVKRILPHLAADPNFVSMFIDEAKLTAQLTHPKIVQVLDFGEVGGQFFTRSSTSTASTALGLLRIAAQKRVHVPRRWRSSSSARSWRRSTTRTTPATWKASRCRSCIATSRLRTSSSPNAAT